MQSASQRSYQEMRHGYADLESVRLHYVTAGNGELILFAHGFPEFWYAWKKQLEEFGRTHLAVAPDLRGYNLSSKPPRVEDYALSNLVEDIRGLAAHFDCGGENKFTLVGHDWGGVVAWAFALCYPEWLKRLIIVNAPHPMVFKRELAENPAQQKASAYFEQLRSPLAEMTLAADNYAMLAHATLAEGLQRGYFTEEDKRAYLEAWSQPGALTGGINYYRAAPFGKSLNEGSEVSEYLPQVKSRTLTVPTLVIWGMKDIYLLPGNLEGLDDYVSDLRVERIPNGSHWVIHEMPGAVNRHIRDFLASESV